MLTVITIKKMWNVNTVYNYSVVMY